MDPNASSTPAAKLSTYTPQADTSKYIRTFAKDVARVTNTPEVPPASNPSAPEDSKREAAALGVSLPEFDSSPVNYKDDGVSPKEFKQEVVQLSEEDSKDIFKGQAAPPATPLMPQASIGVVQAVAPPEPPPTTSAVIESDRESILARLRSKVASQPLTVTPPPTPEGSDAPPANLVPEAAIRAAAPDFSAFTIPVPQTPAQPVTAPAPAPTPSPIHTYSSDFADKIDQKQSSTFSVLAAQSDAGQATGSSKKKKSLVPLLAGVAMLVVGLGAVLGAYLYVEKGTAVPMIANVPSLITFDESVELQGTGEVLMQALADVANGGGVSGNVIVTYVTTLPSEEETASSIPQPGGKLVDDLNLPAPDILLRNIQDSSTVGVITAGEETRPFFIFKVSSYERTFAGMLGWERNIATDLSQLYPAYPSPSFQTGTTTASTSPVAVPNTIITFTDDVVANYDVRILRDSSGRSLIIYGYLGKDILVVARDEAAFAALTSRLRASGN